METNQQVARQTDQFPTREELEQIWSDHQQQHGEDEEGVVAEVTPPGGGRLVGHVPEGKNLNAGRDERHNHGH